MIGVNICEAVKIATQSNKKIFRDKWGNIGLYIQPTNGPECCIVYKNNKPSAKRWNPKAEDLTADDWNVET